MHNYNYYSYKLNLRLQHLRPGKVDLQFIISDFSKGMKAGGHFKFFIIQGFYLLINLIKNVHICTI